MKVENNVPTSQLTGSFVSLTLENAEMSREKKDAAFAVWIPLSQFGTTRVPSHPKAHRKARKRSGSIYTSNSKTDIND